ncbi:MAG: TolC family protein [Chitinophagia bacterium]|nr:TolC family protein [Chitinophagia bacterium]
MKTNRLGKAMIFGTVLLSTIQFSMAQNRNEFSVKQAVDYGLKNAVQVKNALIDIKIQEQTNREITAAAFPQINGSVNTIHYFNVPVQSIPNFISPATYNVLKQEGVKNGAGNPITMPNGGNFGNLPLQFGTPWTSNAGLDFSQLLFDGQVFVGLQARSAAMELSKKYAEVTAEQIKANIYKIYYQLVVGKSQLSSLEANIDRFTKLLHDTKEIYKNGFAEKLDVDKLVVQLNNLTTEKEKVINQLYVGNAGLKFLLNMPQKEELVLTDSLTEGELKSNIMEDSVHYSDRKEIQLLTLASKMNGYNIKRYNLSRIPTVAAFGSYSKNAQRNSFNFFDKGDWFTTSLIGLKIAVPIFDGFARRSKIASAKFALDKSNNSLQQAKESMDYEVIQARIKMKSAILTADVQKQNIQLAEDVFRITQKKFTEGLGSNQEIYNAQTELKVAQNNYYGALYDAISAKIDYLKAAGKL